MLMSDGGYLNYRIGRKKHLGVTLYGLIEVYYYKDGKVSGWTDFIDPNGWEDVDDLKATIKHMSDAFDKPIFDIEEEVKDD